MGVKIDTQSFAFKKDPAGNNSFLKVKCQNRLKLEIDMLYLINKLTQIPKLFDFDIN